MAKKTETPEQKFDKVLAFIKKYRIEGKLIGETLGIHPSHAHQKLRGDLYQRFTPPQQQELFSWLKIMKKDLEDIEK